ncbi:tRNA-binding protein [Mameliella sediminis]|uniref:tRNA-binding protein n=1 Tax=Mameliella sediminis TaxID=2836866 RepID=UPI001C4481BB|nr:tRNA-binding protein [Mameliella sediminis]MBV7395597.1 tRNA-binding protein [Mameliella sediminis]
MQKEQIVYDDFAKVEMRLGRITEVQDFPRARNPSYKVCVDFGALGQRWSSAQITNYAKDDLIGRYVVCVVNMPPRNIAGFQSEILIMGVPNESGQTILLTPTDSAILGSEIF